MPRIHHLADLARLVATLAAVLSCAAGAAQSVNVMADGRPQTWKALQQASRPWRICVLLPQARDKFWWAVSWGLTEQARQLGVELGLYVADSYADQAGQKRQWAECQARAPEAYIVAAVTRDGLDAEIRGAMAAGHPVIDLINGVSSTVTSHSVGDSRALGEMTADYLLHTAQGRAISVAWFPGPINASWADDAERGFLEHLRGHGVQLRQGGRAPTDPRSQATLVREHLERAGMADYLVGNAVAIEFAARLSARRPAPHATLLAYYATEELLTHIADGSVLAAPNNQPVVQARIGLDLAVRALQGMPVPQQLAVRPLMVDRQSLATLDRATLAAPAGERPAPRPLAQASVPAH